MSTEIVIPNDNEEKFIDIALKLGTKKIYFLYEPENFSKKTQEKIESLSSNPNLEITIKTGFIVNQNNINTAIRHSKILVAKSTEKSRALIENKKIKLIYGFEEQPRKDFMHQRASGLNHIMCEIAKKNKTIIGISYSALLKNNTYNNFLLLGRIAQNISLCKKYKVPVAISSFSNNPFELRAHHDVASLFRILGMDDSLINESLRSEI